MEANATTPNAEAAAPINALERRIDLAVAKADIEKEVGQRLNKIGKTAKMPGFRPGKVPAKIIEQQYGLDARYEVLNQALERAFGEAIQEQKLRVAGYPKIEPKNTQNETHAEFSAVFEVYPEFEPKDLKEVEIERSLLEVGAAELESTLQALRKQRVRYEPIDRAAAKDDRVTIDFLGKLDDEPFKGGEAKDYPFVIGQGAMLPDFEAAVIGMKAGESKAFEMTFPGNYHAVDLAGQTVTFDIAVKEVREAILPEIDDDLAKELGIGDGDVNKMRAEIENNLKREVSKRLKAKLKDQVMKALLKVNPIDIPFALVDMEVDRLIQAARQDMEQRGGVKMKDFPIQREWFTDQAKRRVSLGLVLSEIVKVNKLNPKPEQVKAIVDDIAQSYEQPEDVVRWYYAQPQRLAEIEGIALEDNVVSWALESAKVVEKAIAFDELMGQQA